LPTDIVAAAASLVNKAGATAIFGTKPPNDRLQIANLMAQGKHAAEYAHALCTVGAAAITDEIECSAPSPVTCWAFYSAAPVRKDLAWRRVRERPPSTVINEGGAGDASGPSNAAEMTKDELEAAAEKATIVDLQMGAHADGSLLESSTVVCEHGDHIQDNRTASGEVGLRTARPRFPKTSECEEFLFSNDPENLVSAEALRNVGVGVADLSPDQARSFDEAVAALKKHMFTKQRVLKSERYVTRTADVLPKNRTEQQKERMEVEALNAESNEAIPYSTIVAAFCKKEVTGKPKPRPIANHGDERVWGMAKGSAVFEDVMFHTLPYACIKHEEKSKKMNELFTQMDDHTYKVENDLSAFEFGIYDKLKQAECDIFKHIMDHLDLNSENAGFCYRVIAARTKACTWVMNYIDAAGARCRMKIKMPRSMRESGDRITSSGNFLQNLLAWLTFLVKPGKVEAAVQSLIRNKGKSFSYTSARDGRVYNAFLAFEGDDTLGGLNEKILSHGGGQLIDEFFSSYGWKAKLKVASNQGDASINFVGYTALLRDGKLVRDGTDAVMFPDIKHHSR